MKTAFFFWDLWQFSNKCVTNFGISETRKVKLYAWSWLIVTFVAAGLYLTDSFTSGTFIIWGFITHALAGAGLLVIYAALLKQRDSSSGI